MLSFVRRDERYPDMAQVLLTFVIICIENNIKHYKIQIVITIQVALSTNY